MLAGEVASINRGPTGNGLTKRVTIIIAAGGDCDGSENKPGANQPGLFFKVTLFRTKHI